MTPRPLGCDGNHCDYDERGRWEHIDCALAARSPRPEQGERFPGELEMLRGLVRVLRTVVREENTLPEVRRLLWQHSADEGAAYAAREQSSREAPAAHGLTDRQVRLLDALRTHGGEWTTRRVLHLYALTDPGVVQRGTARRDLAALNRAGHLVLVDDPDNRHYILKTRKDDRS
jgi:hypothetical protein